MESSVEIQVQRDLGNIVLTVSVEILLLKNDTFFLRG